MKYSRASIECTSPTKSPEVVIFPPKYPKPDQLQTERKHTYLRQDSQMDLKIPIISEVSPASSPYIRYDDPTYDSVSCTPTTDLNSRSSSNIHGFAIYRHGQTLPQIPQRVLGSHKGCRKNALYECNQTNSIDRQFVSKCSLVIIVAMWVVAMTMAIYSLCMFRDLQSKYSDLQEQLKSTHISLAQTQEESLTCLPCAGLKLGPLPEETKELDLLIQKEEHGIRICCAKTSAQMFVMMNLFVKRKHQEVCSSAEIKEEKTTPCENSVTSNANPPSVNGNISAFVVLTEKQDAPKYDVNELHPIRNWNHTIYGTHLTNINMTHDNTRIVIPESGRYYVYSQVSFLIHYDIDRNNAQEVTQLLYQSVIRYNAMYPLDGNKEMLRGVTTQCWEKQKKYGKYTTYAGASVMLNKGDQIYVKSSTVNHVFNHDSMTYFGLFKIG